MAFNIYKLLIRPFWNKCKGLRHFICDVTICFWRDWDLRLLFSCDLKLLQIPRSTRFPHPVGIVISSRTTIGENCVIRQNVTIGRKNGSPVLGNNVEIGANAVIIGDITIGDNSIIGAGSIVVNDVPPDTVYWCKIQPCLKDNIEKAGNADDS